MEDGVTIVEHLQPEYVSRFIFTRPGYKTLYGGYSAGILSWSEKKNAASSPEFFTLDGPLSGSCRSNGICIVRMPKSGHQ